MLLAATAEHEATRRQEDHRLLCAGITAAEGQRREHWESAQRKGRALLGEEHARAVGSHRVASSQHEQAREALGRADAELRQVRERIEQRERSKRHVEEQAQQEMVDESRVRLFLERSQA